MIQTPRFAAYYAPMAGLPQTARRQMLLARPATWHYLSLLGGAVFLLYVNRDQWFFFDEWTFLAERSVTTGSQGLFEPHNEHWSTTPLLLYGLVFRLAGLSTYLPYVSLVVIAHLAVVHLVWRVSLRSRVDPWIATAFCAAILPFGPGADNLLWAFQIGFVGSVAVGLAAILLEDDTRVSGRLVAARWGTSVFALTFSGISVPLVAASAFAGWMRRGAKAFLIAASVPAAVYLIWFLSVGRSGLGAVPLTEETLRSSPEFFVRSLGAVLSLGTPTLLAGSVPLALSIWALAVRRRTGRAFPYAAIAVAIGQVLLFILFAVGRSALGVEAAGSIRYMYIGGILLLPLMLIGLSDLVGRRAVGVLLVCALAVAWGANNARLLLRIADEQAARERLVHEQLAAAVRFFDPDEALLREPEPFSAPTLTLEELLALPRLETDIRIRREAVIRAALALQVSITQAPRFGQASTPLAGLRAEDAELDMEEGCSLATPTGAQPHVLVPMHGPSSFEVLPALDGDIYLLLSGDGLIPDYSTRFHLTAGQPSYLNFAVDTSLLGPSTLILSLSSPLRVCEVGAEGPDPQG